MQSVHETNVRPPETYIYIYIVSMYNYVLTTYLYIHINNNKPHVNLGTSTYTIYVQYACTINKFIQHY